MQWFDDVQIILIVILALLFGNFLLFIFVLRKRGKSSSTSTIKKTDSTSSTDETDQPNDDDDDDGGNSTNYGQRLSRNRHRRRVLFILNDFADLVLYFGPLLFESLRNNGKEEIFILIIQPCSGLRYEWFKHCVEYVCETVGLSISNVVFVWNQQCPDPETASSEDPWPILSIMHLISSYAMAYDANFIITYDADGINDQPGRQAINESIGCLWRKRMLPENTEIYLLTSCSAIRWMSGVFDAPISWFSSSGMSNSYRRGRLMSNLGEFLLLHKLYLICEYRFGSIGLFRSIKIGILLILNRYFLTNDYHTIQDEEKYRLHEKEVGLVEVQWTFFGTRIRDDRWRWKWNENIFEQTYLESFGYLPKNNPEISNLRSDVAIKTALAHLQEYAGINVTSSLDEPTRRLLRSKRCGMSDAQYQGEDEDATRRRGRAKRFSVFGEKWRKLKLTYKVVNWPPHMDQGQTRRSVYDAFNLWSDSSGLEFQEVAGDDADILIEFARGDHGDGYPFDGKNVVLAHAFFPGNGRGGDAHFDADEIWTHLPSSKTDYEKVNFFTVAAHEFGHSLGLGHSKDKNALMFAYYKDYSELTKLPYDDALAVQHLYGVGKNGVPDVPPSTTETPEPEPPTHATYAPPAGFTPRPDICLSSIDALARIRNEIFVFKGKYFWRYDDEGGLTSEGTMITRFWHGLPEDLDSIDAVFQRPNKETILFFKDRQYWEFSANFVLPDYPKDISTLGMPDDAKRVDAAFVWGWSTKAYLIADRRYWRLDDESLKVEHDYPRVLGKDYWKGVPHHPDAAFTDKHGITYFFKDTQVFKFSNDHNEVRSDPFEISKFWRQCRESKTEQQLPYLRSSVSHSASSHVLLYFALLYVLKRLVL